MAHDYARPVKRLGRLAPFAAVSILPLFFAAPVAVAAPGPNALMRDFALSIASDEGVTHVGKVASNQHVSFDVVMASSNAAALQTFVSEVSSPNSSIYRHYLTEREFAARFGPRSAVVKEASAWLRADGLSVTRTSTFVLSVQGTVGKASHALGLTFGRYQQEGLKGVMAHGVPSVPASLSGGEVSGFVGLSPSVPVQYLVQGGRAKATKLGSFGSVAAVSGRLHVQATVGTTPGACEQAVSAAAADDSYTVDQMASYYEIGAMEQAGQYGLGVTVALPEISDISETDVQGFDDCYGLSTQPTVTPIDGGPTGSGAQDPTEPDLDFQEVAALAPGAAIDVYQGPPTLTGLQDMLTAIVTADKAQVVSVNVGVCEGPDGANIGSSNAGIETDLEQAASQGQTVLTTSGDSGSEDCYPSNTALSVDYPSSSPYVTSVGGTVATSSGELAWDDCNGTGSATCAHELNGLGASGGGVSVLNSLHPAGQPVIDGAQGREVPDVSAEAGSNFGDDIEFYVDGSWQPLLGTSVSAPIWASLVADKDSSCSTSAGYPSPSGDLAPALYDLYNSTPGHDYGVAFNAVTEGYDFDPHFSPQPGASTYTTEAATNDFTQTNSGDYPVTAGYNLFTGIGSPIASGLACSQVEGNYSAASGQTVTLNGVGLEDATIDFGSQEAQVVSETGTQATVVVPLGLGRTTVSASSSVLGSSPETAKFTYTTGTTTTTTSTTTTSTTTTSTTTTSTTSTTAATTPPPVIPSPGTGTTTTSSTTLPPLASPVTSTTQVTTTTAVTSTSAPASAPAQYHRAGHGYWLVNSAGRVFSFGLSKGLASPRVPAGEHIVAIASTPDDQGYWLVSAGGAVFVAGDARSYGDIPALGIAPAAGAKASERLAAPIVGILPTPDGKGYLLVASDGGLFAFGDAKVLGSCNKGKSCSSPVVAAVADPAGSGYWLVTRGGHVYAYGQAKPYGQCTAEVTAARSPVVAAAASPGGSGFWVLLEDGSVCHAGTAPSYRPPAGATTKAVMSWAGGAAIVPVYGSSSYWVVTGDGRVLRFGTAPQVGDLTGQHLSAPLVAAAGW